jgi:hypothetical protein
MTVVACGMLASEDFCAGLRNQKHPCIKGGADLHHRSWAAGRHTPSPGGQDQLCSQLPGEKHLALMARNVGVPF